MNELTYRREGDYLLPDLIPPEAPRIGVWGMRRREFLRNHRDGIYTGLLLSGKLNAHLEEIDYSANAMFDLLMKQYAERECVTDQMLWVQRVNSIRDRATEIINQELIYT